RGDPTPDGRLVAVARGGVDEPVPRLERGAHGAGRDVVVHRVRAETERGDLVTVFEGERRDHGPSLARGYPGRSPDDGPAARRPTEEDVCPYAWSPSTWTTPSPRASPRSRRR